MPISAVMQLPVSELNLWAEVFTEEYEEYVRDHPDQTVGSDSESESECTSARAFALIGGDVCFGGKNGNSK